MWFSCKAPPLPSLCTTGGQNRSIREIVRIRILFLKFAMSSKAKDITTTMALPTRSGQGRCIVRSRKAVILYKAMRACCSYFLPSNRLLPNLARPFCRILASCAHIRISSSQMLKGLHLLLFGKRCSSKLPSRVIAIQKQLSI
ncbi:hypothetical protein D3C85_1319880 [compost metagenome]